MSSLTNKQKLKTIIEICERHNITAYEIGKNTNLNQSGVQRLLNGEVKKPRTETLDTILSYLKKSDIVVIQEPEAQYQKASKILDGLPVEKIVEYIIKNESRFLDSKSYDLFVKIKLKDAEIKRLTEENEKLQGNGNKLKNSNSNA